MVELVARCRRCSIAAPVPLPSLGNSCQDWALWTAEHRPALILAALSPDSPLGTGTPSLLRFRDAHTCREHGAAALRGLYRRSPGHRAGSIRSRPTWTSRVSRNSWPHGWPASTVSRQLADSPYVPAAQRVLSFPRSGGPAALPHRTSRSRIGIMNILHPEPRPEYSSGSACSPWKANFSWASTSHSPVPSAVEAVNRSLASAVPPALRAFESNPGNRGC